LEKTKFFYDSYAVIAYLSDNSNYRDYFEGNDGVLTKLNLIEITYRTIELHGEEAAAEVVKLFAKYTVDFGPTDIVESMKLRSKLKKDGRNISSADAVGYYLALKNKLKFLTGDKEFKGLDNVEFVK
jgi:predicted nucleic acid-binding protein